MLDRQKGLLIFECDSCGKVLDTEERDIEQANLVRDRAGWRARKIGVDWVHSCEKCAEKVNER